MNKHEHIIQHRDTKEGIWEYCVSSFGGKCDLKPKLIKGKWKDLFPGSNSD